MPRARQLHRAQLSPREPLGVVVACRHTLIRDTLLAALDEHGIATIAVPESAGGRQLDDVRRWSGSVQRTYGLLVTELDDAAQLFEGIHVLSTIPVVWLVLTSLPAGPAWGALLEAGADDVLPASTSLEELTARIRDPGAAAAALSQREREHLIASWRRISGGQQALNERLAGLSTREMEILEELHKGRSVRMIATRAGVAEGTVRTQVKSLLKKLGANSQLQAVAYYREATSWLIQE